MMNNEQELDKVIFRGKKAYRQIKKSERAYIYKVTDTETEHIYYEVFERRFNRRFKCISYPTDKAFGKWAWCISKGKDHIAALESTLKRFDLLSEQKQAA